MRHLERALWLAGLSVALGCASPRSESAGTRTAASGGGAGESAVRFHFDSHLAFGARVETASLLVDGVSAWEGDAASMRDGARVAMRPGPHTLAVLVTASEPCGLLEEPRASVAARGTLAVVAGEGPASIAVDLFATEATRDPLRSMGLRVEGRDVVLGPGAAAPAPPEADALASVDALAERARERKDASAVACYERRRTELRLMQDTVDDGYALMKREGTTTGAAESAQLRVRYAEERMRSLAVSARTCDALAAQPAVLASVERRVERSCPGPDLSAER